MANERAASLGSFGLVAGLAAAATFLPDGCVITKEGSQHLREGLPIVTPLLFGLLGLVLAKRARWSALQGAVAFSAWALVVAVLGTGKPSDTLLAMAALWPFGVAALALSAIVTRQSNPWPWIAAVEGLAILACWANPPSGRTLDLRLAVATLGAHAFVTLVAGLLAPRPWRARSAILVGIAVGALIVGVFLVLQAPQLAPSHDAPFSISNGC